MSYAKCCLINQPRVTGAAFSPCSGKTSLHISYV
jgi:hypothetical protein